MDAGVPLRAGGDDHRGLYETSGDWLYDIGLPGKSGIGGGIVTVSPGKGGLGIGQPLDNAGNSVRDNWWPDSCPSNWEWFTSRGLKVDRTAIRLGSPAG